MKTKVLNIFNTFALLAIVFGLTSCNTPYSASYKMLKATGHLERVEESQNFFGKIAVSDLDFVANKGQFNINYNEDATNYVQAARNNISGDASGSVQTAMYLGALLQGSFVPPISAGTPPTGSNSLPGTVSLPNQAETAVNSFTIPPPLNLNPASDERDAVEKGMNDKLAEKFLEFMTNPEIDTNNDAIVFGVMQATCEPGQHTRKGYVAELDISLKYARTNQLVEYTENTNLIMGISTNIFDLDQGRYIPVTIIPNNGSANLPEPIYQQSGKCYYPVETDGVLQVDDGDYPSVLAVLPLMDTRNMELQNNNESQFEVAEALSAAFAAKGMTAAANILSDYVKRQQSNIQTLNSLPVATTYANGSDFGFQLYPSVEAIEHPGLSGSSAADVLEPVTFPIVVALKVDKADVAATNSPWNFLAIETQTRWIPLKPNLWNWLVRHGVEIVPDWIESYPLFQREGRAEDMDKAAALLDQLVPGGEEYPDRIPPAYLYEYQQMRIALDSLEASAISSETVHSLPDPSELFPKSQADTNAPSITDVFPHTIWRDTNTDFVILVKNVTSANEITNVAIAGVSCSTANVIEYVSRVGTNEDSVMTNVAIQAMLPPVFYSITNNVTNNVDFVVLFKDKAPATKTIGLLLQGRSLPQANVTFTRDVNSRLLGINIQPGSDLTGTNLLKAINAVLQKSEPPPKTVNIIH